MSDYALYTVEKDGKTVKLKSSQLSTVVLSKVFGLFPESILLLSDDGYVETADNEGRFHDVDDLPVWTVSGESMRPADSASGSSVITQYSYQPPASKASKRGRGKGRWTPMFTTATFGQRQKPPGVRAQEAAALEEPGCSSLAPNPVVWRKYIEICKWSEHDQQWKKFTNLPIEMTEATATVPRVTQMVADDVFGGDEAVLLDIDYLKIPDTATTMGSRFWKTSKRIRAVRKVEVKLRKGKTVVLDSSSDSDFEAPLPTKRQKTASLEERLKKLEGEMLRENVHLHAEKDNLHAEKDKQLKAMKNRLTEVRQCFHCLVCKTKATFPAIVAPCCNIVIGCETCITQWLETSQHCPHCRSNITIQECSKLPFIRSLSDALGESSSASETSSPTIELD